jgi:hypothetical protein
VRGVNTEGDGVNVGFLSPSASDGPSADFDASPDLRMVSAGNGMLVLAADSLTGDSLTADSLAGGSVAFAGAAESAGSADPSASEAVTASSSTSAEVAFALPLTPVCVSPDVRDAPVAVLGRELPGLVRDEGMGPLSLTASSDSPSGSNSWSSGATMSGVSVLRPASSTPSSSVLTTPAHHCTCS